MMAFEDLIPPEVQRQYALEVGGSAKLVSGGMINRTVLVNSGKLVVMQRVSPIFDELQTEDYQNVSEHLQNEGWEVPSLLVTTDGAITTKDNEDMLWRGFEFIESDNDSTEQEALDLRATKPLAYGVLLAKLHQSLGKFNYQPKFQLPNFHDTAHYADVLREARDELPTKAGRDVADNILDIYDNLPELPHSDLQLIHGDPRTANILNRDGVPFTFIDWDTLMQGTIWMDMGDMLRSLSEDALQLGNAIPIDTLRQVAEGYRQVAFDHIDSETFCKTALLATQRISIELAMRFVADHRDGEQGYFQYDESEYASRHDFTLEMAGNQLEIYRQLEEIRSGMPTND